jgi:Short C-terminal domain
LPHCGYYFITLTFSNGLRSISSSTSHQKQDSGGDVNDARDSKFNTSCKTDKKRNESKASTESNKEKESVKNTEVSKEASPTSPTSPPEGEKQNSYAYRLGRSDIFRCNYPKCKRSGDKWAQAQAAQMQAQAAQTNRAQGKKDITQELEKLASLKQQGILTDEEFQQMKARVLSSV